MLIPRLEEIGYRLGYTWLEESQRSFAKQQSPVFAPPKADVLECIVELETLAGPLPLSLRAWYETAGAVNLVGAAPEQWRVDERADPLYVYPIEAAHTSWEVDKTNDPGPFRVPIAPDYLHKYNISGGMWYHLVLPNPAMDAPLKAERHAAMFVEYMHICFRWGGLPGLDRSAKVLAPSWRCSHAIYCRSSGRALVRGMASSTSFDCSRPHLLEPPVAQPAIVS